MTKSELLDRLEDELANPGAQKSGEFLEAHVVDSARRTMDLGGRDSVVGAMTDWVQERSEPKTMLAVSVAKELKLTELRAELKRLKAEVESGRAFLPFYGRRIDDALRALD